MQSSNKVFLLFISWIFLTAFQLNLHAPTAVSLSKEVKEEVLSRHNHYRKQVGVPPLKWSDELANYAQEWANKLAKRCELHHQTDDDYGENIFWSSSPKSATYVVDYWANEEELFNHRKRVYKFGKGYGHYTQMIWHDTKYVGAGVADCANGGQIWVCNYDPAGNWEDEKVY